MSKALCERPTIHNTLTLCVGLQMQMEEIYILSSDDEQPIADATGEANVGD